MQVITLQSGSNGNCIYVEAENTRLLFDAGISGIQAEKRLASFGRDIRDVDALIISHDHSDHVRGAGVFGRKYGIPLYATAPTLEAATRRTRLGTLREHRSFTSGDSLHIGAITVETLPTPHDAADGVAFVVSHDNKRCGIMTDLGHVFDGLGAAISTLDGIVLESNFDVEMLANGSYPAFLKKRISGDQGHISNEDAAHLLGARCSSRLQWACLAHLSQENNTPDKALNTHLDILGQTAFEVTVASRYEPRAMPPIE